MSLLSRRMLMNQTNVIIDDNLINMDEYSIATSTYNQRITIDSTKTYYIYDYNYFTCFNKWSSNIGIGSSDNGKAIFKDGTIEVEIFISPGKNPYFGLTKRS